jgi:hypothetical protein
MQSFAAVMPVLALVLASGRSGERQTQHLFFRPVKAFSAIRIGKTTEKSATSIIELSAEVPMTLALDCDLFGFLWTTAKVVFGSKPQLRKNSLPIPVRYQREVIEESALSERQKLYFAPLDAHLAALNYRPMCTFRVANYGSNLLREYSNPADPATCTLTIVEVKTNVKGVKGVKNSHVVNFTTRFSGGKWLTTRNMELKSVMDNPDHRVIQECQHLTDVAELKKRHDARSTAFGTPISPPRDIRSLFEEYEMENQRFFAHQVQRGIYKLSPAGDAYVLTDKAFNRGIRNHFNPFAHRISLPVAVFSILIGAVLPLFGILKLAPSIAERFGPGPYSIITPSTLAIVACYALAGVILGLIAESQNYVWVMLITYVPAHLVAGSSLGRFPYSSLAFVISYFVCQAKRKRQLVLQS